MELNRPRSKRNIACANSSGVSRGKMRFQNNICACKKGFGLTLLKVILSSGYKSRNSFAGIRRFPLILCCPPSNVYTTLATSALTIRSGFDILNDGGESVAREDEVCPTRGEGAATY
jgi:hypothetical protein